VTLNGDSIPYYVMPYIEDESLRDRLTREKQLPIEDTIAIARDVAAALAHAHKRGFIHRDIKPENILLAGHEAVVADFGIARAIDRSADPESVTTSGIAIGTPAYMSPEQASAQAELDGRTDIYSLGCVVYEMLGGDPPFSGSSANAIAARHRVDQSRRCGPSDRRSPPAGGGSDARPGEDTRRPLQQRRAVCSGTQPPADPNRTEPGAVLPRPGQTNCLRSSICLPPCRTPSAHQALRIGAGSVLGSRPAPGRMVGDKARTAHRYSETPAWSPWRGWVGEYFPLFAVAESTLVTMPLGGKSVHLFDGQSWTTLAVPDSFAVLRYTGPLVQRRLLAVKSVSDTLGRPSLQYWWMSACRGGAATGFGHWRYGS
jgi:serine/threonine protein kinase